MCAPLAVASCGGVDFEDGVIACGDAGCPPGMACATDGLCYTDLPDAPTPGTPSDGAPDSALALATGGESGLQLQVSCGESLTSAWTVADMDVDDLAWGDTNGDGAPELAVIESDGPVSLVAVTLEGPATLWTSPKPKAQIVEVADVTGDGFDDLLVGYDKAATELYASNGQGGFSLAWVGELAPDAQSFALADYDGDGDLDLAAAVEHGVARVFRNTGGAFEAVWASEEKVAKGVAWGDHDGDGRYDLALGGDGPARLLVQVAGDDDDDDFSFATVWESTEFRDLSIVSFDDFDGDGDGDLSFGGKPTDLLFRNDGGEFTLVWLEERDKGGRGEDPSTQAMAWTDVNGDGLRDLYAGREDAPDELLIHDGTTLSAVVSLPETQTRAAAWQRLSEPAAAVCAQP